MTRHATLVRRVSRFLLTFLTVIPLLALSGCADGLAGQQVTGPTVRVGISFDQPGLAFKDGTHYSGFDVDVAEYVANVLGFSPWQIQWVQAPLTQRESMLEDGEVDYVLSTYSIDRQREKSIDFAGPYLVAGQDLLIRKSDHTIRGLESLPAKKVCVQQGSTSEAVLQQSLPTARVTALGGLGECVTALETGTVDAVSGDNIILALLSATKGEGTLRLVGRPFTREEYGVGVRKGSVQLERKINSAIRQMIANGVWRKDLNTALRGTGFRPNPSWNPPAQNGAPSDHDPAHFLKAPTGRRERR